MEKTIIQFQKEFLSGKADRRVVVVHGEERYLVRAFLSKLREKFGKNYRVLWGDEITEEELFSALSERSMFSAAGSGVVVLYNFEDFLKRLGRRKKAREGLIKILRNLKSNYLFILYDRKLQKTELSSEPLKSILSFGILVSAGRLSKEKVKNLVAKKFAEKGIKVEREALEYLLERTEYDLSELKLEVEKLIDYASEEKLLTLADVKRVLFTVKGDASVYEFVDALLLGEGERALQLLESLYRAGVHPLQIQKVLASYLLKLYTVKKLSESGTELSRALEKVGIRNNFLKLKFRQYLERNDAERLKRLINGLQRVDLFEKLYFQPPEEVLREFVLQNLLASSGA
ncbi:MAG: DNA polymerase III subunit delta [Aquificae bacterium]|nr:DNA polymerase III subunit delta [Aquificota bacterium]